ncbi:hypothetical protein MRQ36_05585 [Micromonospora sp. R77]|uniref:hypothetical protein n=1 Tax=Micromonospora sp. R77 TaxID=2925836 RepID=UPI001F623CC0|nr:hypothetical protein [Micromonospora sp. R77]MCI4062063.1 hypothetical protein [Micromonospora sp. R77]
MSSYRDPAPRGDVYPSEEEIDPTGMGPDPAYPGDPVPAPVPPPRVTDGGSHSIVTHHLDGSTEVVTDLDGDGIADVVQIDVDGDGVPDITYLDSDRDGRLDTVLRAPGRPTR